MKWLKNTKKNEMVKNKNFGEKSIFCQKAK